MASLLDPQVEWVKKRAGVLKIVTLVVNIICIGILVDNGIIILPHASLYFLPVTTGGFLLVDIFLIINYTFDGNYGKSPIQELTIAFLGAIFHLAAGSVAINAFDNGVLNSYGKGAADAYGAFSIINAALYITTGYFRLKEAGEEEYEDPTPVGNEEKLVMDI